MTIARKNTTGSRKLITARKWEEEAILKLLTFRKGQQEFYSNLCFDTDYIRFLWSKNQLNKSLLDIQSHCHAWAFIQFSKSFSQKIDPLTFISKLN